MTGGHFGAQTNGFILISQNKSIPTLPVYHRRGYALWQRRFRGSLGFGFTKARKSGVEAVTRVRWTSWRRLDTGTSTSNSVRRHNAFPEERHHTLHTPAFGYRYSSQARHFGNLYRGVPGPPSGEKLLRLFLPRSERLGTYNIVKYIYV